MQQPHQQTPIMDPLDLLEQQLVTAIETCHTNTLLLKNYKRSEQQQLFSNVDKYVTTLGDIYDTASGLTNQQVRRRTLLEIDSGINPLYLLRSQVDEIQNKQDAVRGEMAQAEIFRDTLDTLIAQWIEPNYFQERDAEAQQHLQQELHQQQQLQQQQPQQQQLQQRQPQQQPPP